MLIPIVRRRITITTRGVVDLAFSCAACGLATLAHVQTEGVGVANAAYVQPDEERARVAAIADQQRRARDIVAASLCPRCGVLSATFQERLRDYDAKHPQGARRRLAVFLAGLGVSAAITLSCTLAMVLFPTKGMSTTEMLTGPALCAAMFFMGIGGLVSFIAYMFSSPKKRPEIPTKNPANLWFDPPRP